eukprot:768252-Hanusia_phi.AAC.1
MYLKSLFVLLATPTILGFSPSLSLQPASLRQDGDETLRQSSFLHLQRQAEAESSLCSLPPCSAGTTVSVLNHDSCAVPDALSCSSEDGLSPLTGGGFSNKGEPPVQIRGFSLANLTLGLGIFITLFSFYQYFTNQNSLTSLGFVYGLPIALGGFALKYAEILPVDVETDERGEAVFAAKANEILRKVREDVTRHRYGDDAHLDSSLEKLGLVVEGKGFPQMQKVIIKNEEQRHSIQGDAVPVGVQRAEEKHVEMSGDGMKMGRDLGDVEILMRRATWADPVRVKRYETFFGGDVNAEVDREARKGETRKTVLLPSSSPLVGKEKGEGRRRGRARMTRERSERERKVGDEDLSGGMEIRNARREGKGSKKDSDTWLRRAQKREGNDRCRYWRVSRRSHAHGGQEEDEKRELVTDVLQASPQDDKDDKVKKQMEV